ncbi:MAG: hypothetical protein IPK63_19375 [Candidatus Competibacteraceae bacterium]|nr:hypothetical protein [Candidatus Competibacteraceae bacterium]
MKLPRARLRAALATLETAGRLDERELPTDQRRGRKKHYLHCAKASGAIAAEMDTHQPTAPPIAPDISIAPPYRETRNGAIDAVPVSPASLHCANPNGAIAAQWRNSEELPQDTPAPPTVEATPPAKGTGGGRGKDRTADALEAEGRRLLEAAKTAPSGVKVLETGEYIDDPAPGSRVDLRNRGNRLLEQARVMRLAPSKSPESPPVDAEDLDGDWEEIL